MRCVSHKEGERWRCGCFRSRGLGLLNVMVVDYDRSYLLQIKSLSFRALVSKKSFVHEIQSSQLTHVAAL